VGGLTRFGLIKEKSSFTKRRLLYFSYWPRL